MSSGPHESLRLVLADDDLQTLLPEAIIGKVRAVTPLTRGMSGAQVFAVEADGAFVLRKHRGERASWGRLLSVYKCAADAGVAPPLLHVDDAAQAFVTPRIAMSLPEALRSPAGPGAVLQSVVDQLAALQKAMPPSGLSQRDTIELALELWEEQAARPGFPAWALPLGTQLRRAAAAFAADGRAVMSHGDLNPGNILWDSQRAWLVDWECGGLMHPHVDLVSLACFLSLPDAATEGLLARLLGAPLDTSEHAALKAVKVYVRAVYGAVFARLIPDLTTVAFASPDAARPLGESFSRDMTDASVRADIVATFLAQALRH